LARQAGHAFGLELTDLGDTFKDSQFKVFRAVMDGGGVIKRSRERRSRADEQGATEEVGGVGEDGVRRERAAYIKWSAGGEWESPIVKFFSESEKAALAERMGFAEGDVLFFGADKWEPVCEVLGRVRLRCAELLSLIADKDALNFLWVVDFPLLAFAPEENKWVAVHHPFTRPKTEDMAQLESGEFAQVRAIAYDVVLNGVELGGGSIRIHEKELQAKMFEALGVNAEEQQEKFSHLLRAFSFGAPPHGGSRSVSIAS
jgi:aspartyl-tRNA synthetase